MEEPITSCKVYKLGDLEMVHIAEFANITHRTIQSTRVLIERGNTVRKLKYYRDRSRLMIPVKELYGFPLVQAGHSVGIRQIFHYAVVDGEYQKVLCEKCTYTTEWCDARREAEELVVPEGDK